MSEAPQKKDLVTQACDAITKMAPEKLAPVLPSDVSVDAFTRVTLMAIQQNPELATVDDRSSLFNSIVRAAQQGLVPDGREGALVIFSKKAKRGSGEAWVKGVQWMPMVYGLIKSAGKTGVSLRAVAVYRKDVEDGRFRMWVDERGEHVTHEQDPFATAESRGDLVGVYALAIGPNGQTFVEALGLEEIEKVRAASRAKDSGPWKDWYVEMAKKSAIHRLCKRLPPTLFGDRALQAVREVEDDFDVIDPAAVPAGPEKPATVARLPDKRPKGLQKVVEAGQPLPQAAAPEPEPEPARGWDDQALDEVRDQDQREFF